MPYKNREKQLAYMRQYMKRKRMKNRIVRLKQRKQLLKQQYENEPVLRLLVPEEEVGSYIDGEIARLEGLLKMSENVRSGEVVVNP